MFYLILAFCSSAAVSIVMRFSDRRVSNSLGMLAVNYVACTALAALECRNGLLPMVSGLGSTLAMGCLNGVFYLSGFVLFQRSVRRSGVVLSATFMKLSLLVTMLISVVFFGEQPAMIHWLGFLLAVGAIVLINYDGSGMGGFQPALLVLLVMGGLCDGMSKVYEELGTASLSPQFLFYTFLVAMVLCAALAWRKQQLPGKWEWIYGLAIGIPNFYSARFMLNALNTVPGVIAYPVYSVAGILMVTLAGLILFREKLSRRQWLALGIILVALIMLNV